ncbi:MAG: hypothetical protein QOJ30_1754 [Pseudonocardiales bacterium]|nr:hypothetical protein [Pseudonocardiales bacterium]
MGYRARGALPESAGGPDGIPLTSTRMQVMGPWPRSLPRPRADRRYPRRARVGGCPGRCGRSGTGTTGCSRCPSARRCSRAGSGSVGIPLTFVLAGLVPAFLALAALFGRRLDRDELAHPLSPANAAV